MKKTMLSLLCLAAVSLQLSAQHSALWKIVSPSTQTTSYILGITDKPGTQNLDMAVSATPAMEKVNAVAFSWLPSEDEKSILTSIHQWAGDESLKRYYKREDQIKFELMVKNKLNGDPEDYFKTHPLYLRQLFLDKDHNGSAGYQRMALYELSLHETKPALSLLTARQIAATMEEIDFAQQAAILSDYVNRENDFREADKKLFNAYIAEDMNEYENILYATELPDYMNGYYNTLNILLSDKIAKIADQQSTLFIVETDQLVGDKGVLNKLEEAGFIISDDNIALVQKASDTESADTENMQGDNFPSLSLIDIKEDPDDIAIITSSDTAKNFQPRFTGLYDPFGDLFDYTSADTAFLQNWFNLHSPDANFNIRVPKRMEWETSSTNDQINGGVIQYGTNSQNDAKSDLYYSVGYTIYPPQFNPGTKAEFFNSFKDNQVTKLGGELIDQRIISTPEYTGREFTVVVADSFFVRSQLILKGNILYQLLIGGPGNNAYSKYASAFFNSFRLEGSHTSDWFNYKNASFSCNLPTPPGRNTQTYSTPNGPLTIESYSSDDYREEISYFVSLNTYPAGYKLKGKNGFYKDLVAKSEKTYVGRASKTENVKKDGHHGKYVELQLNNGKIYRIYFFIDHNVVYEYLAGGDPFAMESPNVKYFFDTFHIGAEQ